MLNEMGNRNASGLKVEENTDNREKAGEEAARLGDVKEKNLGSPAAEDGKDLKKNENENENENSDEKDEENKKAAVQEKSPQETKKPILNPVKEEHHEAGNENAHVSADLETLEDSEAEKQNQKVKEEESANDEAMEQSRQENDAELENHVISVVKEAEETGGELDSPNNDPENKEESEDDGKKHKEKEEDSAVIESSEQSLPETSDKDVAIGENHVTLTEEQEKADNNPRSESLEAEVTKNEALGEETENGKPMEESKQDEENAASSELVITEPDSEKNEKECRTEEAQIAENVASEEGKQKEALLSPNPELIPAEDQRCEEHEEEPKEKKIAEEIEGKASDPTNIIQAPMQESPSSNLEESKQIPLQFQDKATIETLPNQANGEKLLDCLKNEAVPEEKIPVGKVETFLVSSKGDEDEQEEARSIETPKKEENQDAEKKKTIVSVKEVSSSITKGKEKRKQRPPLFFGNCLSCATAMN